MLQASCQFDVYTLSIQGLRDIIMDFRADKVEYKFDCIIYLFPSFVRFLPLFLVGSGTHFIDKAPQGFHIHSNINKFKILIVYKRCNCKLQPVELLVAEYCSFECGLRNKSNDIRETYLFCLINSQHWAIFFYEIFIMRTNTVPLYFVYITIDALYVYVLTCLVMIIKSSISNSGE